MAVVRWSERLSRIVTQSLRPSKLSARPKRPWAMRRGPLNLPVLREPEASAVVAPAGSSKPQAPTSFGVSGRTGWSPRTDGGVTVAAGGVEVALGVGVGVGVGVGLAVGVGVGL